MKIDRYKIDEAIVSNVDSKDVVIIVFNGGLEVSLPLFVCENDFEVNQSTNTTIEALLEDGTDAENLVCLVFKIDSRYAMVAYDNTIYDIWGFKKQ